MSFRILQLIAPLFFVQRLESYQSICAQLLFIQRLGIVIQTSGVLYVAPFSVPQILDASVSPNSSFLLLNSARSLFCSWVSPFLPHGLKITSRQNTRDPRTHFICFPSLGLTLLLNHCLRVFSTYFHQCSRLLIMVQFLPHEQK